MNLKIAIAAIVITGALTGTSAARLQAAAAGPTIIQVPIENTNTDNFCGFPVEIRTTGTVVLHLFLDGNGAFKRVILTAPRTRMTFTNLDTGKSIWTPSANMVQDRVNPDGTATRTLRGLFWHIIVPGQGLVTADVGRLDYQLTFDSNGNIATEEVVFEAGQQDGQFMPMLCSALQ